MIREQRLISLSQFWIPTPTPSYSAKRAGVKRACPNKVMDRIWSMHDAHLGHAFLFLDMLAEYTLLSMTVMVTPCLWYVFGMKLVCPMSKFPQAPFARAPFGERRTPNTPPTPESTFHRVHTKGP